MVANSDLHKIIMFLGGTAQSLSFVSGLLLPKQGSLNSLAQWLTPIGNEEKIYLTGSF